MTSMVQTEAPAAGRPDARLLERVFNGCFLVTERTELVGGAQEPYYQPARDDRSIAAVIYRSDYVSSALHEVAHWCIAGTARRKLPDYGYWYAPDGRNADQQRAFERVEAKPQALEWCFSQVCGVAFNVSADNLNGLASSQQNFVQAIAQAGYQFQCNGLPPRGQRFFAALQPVLGRSLSISDLTFDPAHLR